MSARARYRRHSESIPGPARACAPPPRESSLPLLLRTVCSAYGTGRRSYAVKREIDEVREEVRIGDADRSQRLREERLARHARQRVRLKVIDALRGNHEIRAGVVAQPEAVVQEPRHPHELFLHLLR